MHISQVKKGLMSKLSDSLDARKSTYPDSEEFFQKERDWVAKYQPAIANTSEAFNKITCAQLSKCGITITSIHEIFHFHTFILYLWLYIIISFQSVRHILNFWVHYEGYRCSYWCAYICGCISCNMYTTCNITNTFFFNAI